MAEKHCDMQVGSRSTVLRRVSSTRRGLVCASVIVATIAAGAVESGAQGFNAQRFYPAHSQRLDYITVHSGEVQLPGDWEINRTLSFGVAPLRVDTGEGETALIEWAMGADLIFSYSVLERFRVSVDLPLVAFTRGKGALLGLPADALDQGGVGDLRISSKIGLFNFRRDDGEGFALATVDTVSVPTGDSERFQGEELRFEIRGALDYVGRSGWGVALNVGHLGRREIDFYDVEIGNQITYGLAGRWPAAEDVMLLGELAGEVTYFADDFGPDDAPLEALAGVRLDFGEIFFHVGGGAAVVRGLGAPDWRIFLGGDFSPLPNGEGDEG